MAIIECTWSIRKWVLVAVIKAKSCNITVSVPWRSIMWYCFFKVVKSHMGYLTSKTGVLHISPQFTDITPMSFDIFGGNLMCEKNNHTYPQTLRHFFPFVHLSFIIYLLTSIIIISVSKIDLAINISFS